MRCSSTPASLTLSHALPAQSLAARLPRLGVRTSTRRRLRGGDGKIRNRHPKLELVRLAIPRRVYTNSHMDVVADSVIRVHQRRRDIGGLEFVYESPTLRFFMSRFAPIARDVEGSTADLERQGQETAALEPPVDRANVTVLGWKGGTRQQLGQGCRPVLQVACPSGTEPADHAAVRHPSRRPQTRRVVFWSASE